MGFAFGNIKGSGGGLSLALDAQSDSDPSSRSEQHELAGSEQGADEEAIDLDLKKQKDASPTTLLAQPPNKALRRPQEKMIFKPKGLVSLELSEDEDGIFKAPPTRAEHEQRFKDQILGDYEFDHAAGIGSGVTSAQND